MHINLINQSTAISNSSNPKKGLTADVGNNWESEGKEYVFNVVYMHVVTSLGNAWNSFTVGDPAGKFLRSVLTGLFLLFLLFLFFYFTPGHLKWGEVTIILYEAIIALTMYYANLQFVYI